MKVWIAVYRFLMRLLFGARMSPVYTRNETLVDPHSSVILSITEIEMPKHARYVLFVPRREATGLIFHVGVSTHKYQTIKAWNVSKKIVRITHDTCIGYLVAVY